MINNINGLMHIQFIIRGVCKHQLEARSIELPIYDDKKGNLYK